MIKAAFSSKEIAPQNPFYLMGYVGEARDKPALGIKDIPEINTSCLQVSGHKIIFSVIDVCVISKDKSDFLKKKITDKYTDISSQDIHLIALHSHSCANGTTSGGFNDNVENKPYLELIEKQLINSVDDVMSSLEECTTYVSKSTIEGYYGNRNDINGESDKEVVVIDFIDKNGATIGSWLNIAVHSTVLGPSNRYCSYDLIGTLRQYLSEEKNSPVMAMMGAAGDISNRQYRQGDDFAELERCAKGIFSQITHQNKGFSCNMKLEKMANLRYVIDYDNRTFFPKYKEVLEKVKLSLLDNNISKDQRKLNMTSAVQFERKLEVDYVHKVVSSSVYHLGDVVVVLFGGELSSKLGNKIKRKNPDKTTIFMSCSDDHQGYFIEEEKYGLYYETIATDVPKGVPEKIVNNILSQV